MKNGLELEITVELLNKLMNYRERIPYLYPALFEERRKTFVFNYVYCLHIYIYLYAYVIRIYIYMYIAYRIQYGDLN